jgi:hypothetical protein
MTKKARDSLAVPLDLPDPEGRFKLTGEASVAAAEKNSFVEFVKSSK